MSSYTPNRICVNDDVRLFISNVAARIWSTTKNEEEKRISFQYIYPSLPSTRETLKDFYKFLLVNEYYVDAKELAVKLHSLFKTDAETESGIIMSKDVNNKFIVSIKT